MNNLKIISLLLFIVFSFCCCNREEIVPELDISELVMSFDSDAETKSYYFYTNTAWSVSIPEDWCTVSPTNGKKGGNIELKVSVAENTSYYRRRFFLNINAGNLSDSIVIGQKGKPYLNVLQSFYEFDAQPRLFEMEVEIYDGFFDIKSDAEWVYDYGFSLVSQKNILRYVVFFDLLRNTTPNEREAAITFTQGNLSKTVTIRQAGE